MTQLVLKELGSLEQPRTESTTLSIKIYLNLSTAPAAVLISLHVSVELEQGVIVHTSTDIQHQAKVWLQVLADSLEEPLVRVNLTIVSMFNSEHDVHATALQVVVLEAQVPSRHLPQVKNIFRDVFFLDTTIHDIF